MFDNIAGIYSIVYSRDSQKNPTYINELIASDLIPIGIVLKEQEVTVRGESMKSDILPCIIYKQNYIA